MKKTEDFHFESLGSVASIGNTHAFGLVGKMPVKGYPASFVKKAIMDRSLFLTGGVKEVLAKGRFDFLSLSRALFFQLNINRSKKRTCTDGDSFNYK